MRTVCITFNRRELAILRYDDPRAASREVRAMAEDGRISYGQALDALNQIDRQEDRNGRTNRNPAQQQRSGV